MTDCYSAADLTTPVFGVHQGTFGLVVASGFVDRSQVRFEFEKQKMVYVLLSQLSRLCWIEADALAYYVDISHQPTEAGPTTILPHSQ